MNLTCSYCDQPSELVGGLDIYPHRPDLAHKWFYRCLPCSAYVGCHPGTKKPLGRLANEQLRRAKNRAHAAFDPLWKNGPMKRGDAYHWLAKRLEIPVKACHIGMFDEETCLRVVEVCESAS